MNHLCYGNNLEVLRGFDPETVDLVYLDPPFNANASYSHLFRDESGQVAGAQIAAFEDTWHWKDKVSRQALVELRDSPHRDVAKMVDATVTEQNARIGVFLTLPPPHQADARLGARRGHLHGGPLRSGAAPADRVNRGVDGHGPARRQRSPAPRQPLQARDSRTRHRKATPESDTGKRHRKATPARRARSTSDTKSG